MTTPRWTAGGLLSAVAFSLIVLAFFPAAAWAQYFGRNKVQWDRFDFQVMQTENFSVHFYPEALEGATDASRMAERWYARLSQIFDHEFATPKPIILYADHPDFMQTNVIGAMLGEGTGGVTEGLRTRVAMPLTGIYANTDHVLGHELVHAFQFDIAGGAGGTGLQGMGRMPLWFIEGMAEYLSIGRVDPHTAMWMRDAMIRDDLPTTEVLTRDPRYFPYRFGQAFWAYVAGVHGDEVVGQMYRAGLQGGVGAAIRTVLEISPDTLSARWHEAIRSELSPQIEGRVLPPDVGRLVLAPELGAGDMNLGPALSPDGRLVAFLSERDLFRIDLFLADAETGRVIRRVLTDQSDPHFDALSFIRSAGTWSPDGRQLAVVVFRRGENQIAIVDVERGRVQRFIPVPDLGAQWDPAWSPDGRMLAFAGGAGGISNLYVHDLEAGTFQQLTTGREAVLQPTWSPDGGTIVFATDAGPGTDFENLTYAAPRLAFYEMATGQLQVMDVFEGAKHINPQFSPDGGSVYFVSDRGGFSDVYRLDLATGQAFQVTAVATGVSGLTSLSAALTVSRHSGDMLFSVFDDGNYHVYGLTPAETQGVALADAPPVPELPGVLPPLAAAGVGPVAAYLADPITGLADAADFEVVPYSAALTLDYIGIPYLGIGRDQMGTMVGGAVAAYWGDMLGDRTLGAEIISQGELRDIGGQLFWLNRQGRWDWAAGASRFPQVSGFTQAEPRPDVQPGAYEIQQFRERIAFNRGVVETRYPFDMFRRFEANVTFTNIGFSRDLERALVIGNDIVDRVRESFEAPDDLNLVSATAAFVGDNSFFGFTSPVQGWRYRYEIQPQFGSLTYQQALADYRRYFLMSPFTFAIRGLHFGRYGRDAESPRIQPLFLGHETLMRGYGFRTFRMDECTPNDQEAAGARACPEFDRLVGSRIAVANLEFRIPLFGTQDFGLINLPFLPTEITPFFDMGVAWTSDDSPTFAFEERTVDRVPVFSTGISGRFNILGYMILEAYWAYPFQRPERGGHFGFHIAPGW